MERAHFYTIGYRENEDKPVTIRTARGLEKALKGISIKIHPYELIVGDISKISEATKYLNEHFTLLASSEDGQEALRARVTGHTPQWKGR